MVLINVNKYLKNFAPEYFSSGIFMLRQGIFASEWLHWVGGGILLVLSSSNNVQNMLIYIQYNNCSFVPFGMRLII